MAKFQFFLLLQLSVVSIHVLILKAILPLMILTEERMGESTFDCDSLRRFQMHHLCQQINCVRIILKVSAQFHKILISIHLPFRERCLHLWQTVWALPIVLMRCTKALENLKNLTNFTLAIKKRFSVSKLEENASNWPNIDTSAVDLLTKKNFRSPVPKSHNFVSIALKRKTEGSGEAEIGNFDLSLVLVNQQVTWLQVSMHNPSLMAMEEALQDLPNDWFGVRERQWVTFSV